MDIPSTSPLVKNLDRDELVSFALPPTSPSREHRPIRSCSGSFCGGGPLPPPPLGLALADPAMEGPGLSKPAALVACFSMALLYVATLYAPTVVLRLPPPSSFKSFMIRRFACAAVSSLVSVVATALVLPVSPILVWNRKIIFVMIATPICFKF